MLGTQVLQISKTKWRATLAGCRVLVREHLDGAISISYGPHLVLRLEANGTKKGASSKKEKGCGKDRPVESVENQNQLSHSSHSPLENRHTPPVSHFPTAPPAAIHLGTPKPKTGHFTC